MTSVFSAEGKNIPCTVIEVGPCVVTQVKPLKKMVMTLFSSGLKIRRTNTHRVRKGSFQKPELPRRDTAEFKGFGNDYKLGSEITVDLFSDAVYVDVIGTSKGKGFQGVVKRHGFGGVGQSTHGQHNRLRAPVQSVPVLIPQKYSREPAWPDKWETNG